MTYPMICSRCGQRTEVQWPVADYANLPRTCTAAPCEGTLEPDYAAAPGIAFKGRGWTPKHYA